MFLLCMSFHFLPALSCCADADLPGKASLADRRAKYDAIKARQQAQLAALDEAAARSRRQPEMDEMYLEAKQRSMVRIFGCFVRNIHSKCKPCLILFFVGTAVVSRMRSADSANFEINW
jgi:hypothetical protein